MFRTRYIEMADHNLEENDYCIFNCTGIMLSGREVKEGR